MAPHTSILQKKLHARDDFKNYLIEIFGDRTNDYDMCVSIIRHLVGIGHCQFEEIIMLAASRNQRFVGGIDENEGKYKSAVKVAYANDVYVSYQNLPRDSIKVFDVGYYEFRPVDSTGLFTIVFDFESQFDDVASSRPRKRPVFHGKLLSPDEFELDVVDLDLREVESEWKRKKAIFISNSDRGTDAHGPRMLRFSPSGNCTLSGTLRIGRKGTGGQFSEKSAIGNWVFESVNFDYIGPSGHGTLSSALRIKWECHPENRPTFYADSLWVVEKHEALIRFYDFWGDPIVELMLNTAGEAESTDSPPVIKAPPVDRPLEVKKDPSPNSLLSFFRNIWK
jgi:hypothetical protein